MSHDVFISYASSDRAAAEQVCAALETRGIRCWIAPRNVLPGEDWGMAILAAISAARCMVVVHSAATGNSIHVRNEVVTATSQRLPLVPVRVDEAPPGGALRLHLAAWHWLNAYPPPVAAHAEMLASGVRASFADVDTTVNLSLRRPGEAAGFATTATASLPPDRPVLPPPPAMPPAKPGGRGAILAMGGLALVLAGFGAWYLGLGPGRSWLGLGGGEGPAVVTLAEAPETPGAEPAGVVVADPPLVAGGPGTLPPDPSAQGGPGTATPPSGAPGTATLPGGPATAGGPGGENPPVGPVTAGGPGSATPPNDPPRTSAGAGTAPHVGSQAPPAGGQMQPVDLGEPRPAQTPPQQRPPPPPPAQPALLVIHNAGQTDIDVVNFSPVSDTQWGENWLGRAQITPGNRVLLPRPAQAGCQFDIRIIWRDRRTEELRRQDVCARSEYRFDGSKARLPGAPR